MAAPTVSRAGPAAAALATGAWTTDTPSGFKRQEVTYVTVGSRMYLAGGKSTRQQAFDPSTHTWSNVAPLPVALDHIQAIALNGLVYYVGGLNGYPGTSFGAVYVYDPVTNTVTTVAPLPAGRDRGAGGIVTYQGKIYVAGGFHTGASVAWFDVYDPVTNTWQSLPDMPERRDHTSAAVVAGKLYVIGGRTYGMGPRRQNDAYDFATGRWTTGLAPLPTLRAGAASAVFGDEVVMIGGEVVGQGTFNTVEAYSTSTNTWRTMTSMPTARHGIQAAVFNGSLYIADGGTKPGGGGQTDVQEVFRLDDAGPPTVPGRPAGASVRPGQIDLTWSASTDDSSTQITYQVFRDGGPTPVGVVISGSSTQVTYTDTGLAPSSVHSYAVVAVDGAGNAECPEPNIGSHHRGNRLRRHLHRRLLLGGLRELDVGDTPHDRSGSREPFRAERTGPGERPERLPGEDTSGDLRADLRQHARQRGIVRWQQRGVAPAPYRLQRAGRSSVRRLERHALRQVGCVGSAALLERDPGRRLA